MEERNIPSMTTLPLDNLTGFMRQLTDAFKSGQDMNELLDVVTIEGLEMLAATAEDVEVLDTYNRLSIVGVAPACVCYMSSLEVDGPDDATICGFCAEGLINGIADGRDFLDTFATPQIRKAIDAVNKIMTEAEQQAPQATKPTSDWSTPPLDK